MRVAWDTSPGHPEQPNQDFVGAVPGAVVMLDGAGIPGTENLCHHGVTWYTRNLGGALLARLATPSGPPLASILADSIDEVTDRRLLGSCWARIAQENCVGKRGE
ncbi:MAG TPA: hypothetical protein VFJ14_17300 [Nocardioidaceae bacterium]|nr:hypothetical protein [Nocardioidaceae bacterium]